MKKVLYVVTVLGVTAVAATPAQAAKPYSIDSSVNIAVLQSTGSPPISGTSDYAGTVKGALGSGAILGQNVFGPVPDFHGTFRTFFKKGTLTGTLEASGSPNADGSISFSGTGAITKGTGKFKGAKGKFTFEGSQAANSTNATFEVKGSIKY